MKILITGGQGQLGHDCQKILQDQHNVLACSSEELDITSPTSVGDVFESFQPDVLINCAAYTDIDACEENFRQAMAVNALGPSLLARECKHFSTRLIHISTDYVFDGQKKLPASYHEEDTPKPLSQYGKTKLAGEQAVQELDNHLIIRTGWLYGANGTNFLKNIAQMALSSPETPISVVNDQYGAFTWTGRLALQIQELLETDLTGIVHASASGRATWYTGACIFLQCLELPCKLLPCITTESPTLAARPMNSMLDNRRLREKGLDSMAEWRGDVERFAIQHGPALLQEARQKLDAD